MMTLPNRIRGRSLSERQSSPPLREGNEWPARGGLSRVTNDYAL
jgi:hypothetical protein